MRSSPAPLPSPNHIQEILPAAFFAALFFLCSADQFFTSRFHGFNFRWGQLLLLGWVFYSAARLQNPADFFSTRLKPFLISWAPFAAAYAIAAALSPNPALSGIKLLWGCVNISLAFGLFALTSNRPSLEKGIRMGILGIALILWLDSILIYWFHCFQDVAFLYPSAPLTLHWFNFPVVVGFAQPDESFFQDQMVRPNAFYYEPSYAGCALSFATLLIISSRDNFKSKGGLWIPAAVLSAIPLTTSRAGILGITLGIGFLFFLTLFNPSEKKFSINLLKMSLIAGLLILLFSIPSPFGRKYLGTLAGYKGVQSLERINIPHKTESGRIAEWGLSFNQLKEHLWFGQGVHSGGEKSALKASRENTWLEISQEAGLMGIAGFFFAILSSMRRAFQKSTASLPVRLSVLAAWLVHFGISLNFCQTFPRLDFWLLFYFSLYLLSKDSRNKAGARSYRRLDLTGPK